MLISFLCKNFTVFKGEAALDMRATADTTHESDNVFQPEGFRGLRLLKAAVLYGPNAGGKTKLLEAMGFMRRFVLFSSKDTQAGEEIPVKPFLLDVETRSQPSEFEITFLSRSGRVRYGFSITSERVEEEWLYLKKPGPRAREVEMFTRKGKDIHLNPSRGELKDLQVVVKSGLVRPNALLLSVGAQFNVGFAVEVLEWFSERLQLISGIVEQGGDYVPWTLRWTQESPENKKKLLKLLETADLGIADFEERYPPENWDLATLPEPLRNWISEALAKGEKLSFGVETLRPVFEKGKKVDYQGFSLHGEESAGTERFFGMAGPLLDSLENSRVLLVDEFDARLHPVLARHLLSLILSKDTNPNNAQLICSTHNVQLMDKDFLRRDQIWFLEKDNTGAAGLYSLAEFKTDQVRKTDDFAVKYLAGRFGALPLVDELTTLFADD